jgi:hypothetical protein
MKYRAWKASLKTKKNQIDKFMTSEVWRYLVSCIQNQAVSCDMEFKLVKTNSLSIPC